MQAKTGAAIALALIMIGLLLGLITGNMLLELRGAEEEPVAADLSALESGTKVPNQHFSVGRHVCLFDCGAISISPKSPRKVDFVLIPIVSEECLAEAGNNVGSKVAVVVYSRKFPLIDIVPKIRVVKESVRGMVMDANSPVLRPPLNELPRKLGRKSLDGIVFLEEDRKPERQPLWVAHLAGIGAFPLGVWLLVWAFRKDERELRASMEACGLVKPNPWRSLPGNQPGQ